MTKIVKLNKKIGSFKKSIIVPGDKSLSIRWVLFASLANGTSKAKNLLMSEDVLAAIKAIKKLGIRVTINKKECIIFGKGFEGYQYKKNLKLNAQNSGTLGRLILGLLVNSLESIALVGDKSLSKRDFKRISDPLSKFGVKFKLSNKKFLPLKIQGSSKLNPVKYFEKRGSAQCKSSVIFAAMRTNGTTIIKAKKSRNHTELLFRYLGLPITIKKKKEIDIIKVKGQTKIKQLNYKIPSDISSSAFFIVLTILSKNSKLILKNVNINPTRIGILKILKLMKIKIQIKNKKNYKGELIADLYVKSHKKINSVNCPSSLNSSSIDEFLLIFLLAAKANGISYFKNISELNQKESPRLKWGSKILNEMGVKNSITSNSIKIYGNPNLKIFKKIVIKNFLKDHRVFMACTIAALTFGGKWEIFDKNSIKTSFPSFLDKLKELGVKF